MRWSAVHGIAGQIFRADSIFLWFSGTSGAKQSNFPRLIVSPLSQHFALAIRKTDIFTGVLGIIESGFSGTRVLKLSELVLRTNESSFSKPRFSKTSESSFSESDCGNRVLDRTTTTSLCTAAVPRVRRLWSRSTQKVSSRPWTSGPLCEGLETELDQPGGESVCQREPDYLNQRLGGNPVRWEG